jgi:putative transposase
MVGLAALDPSYNVVVMADFRRNYVAGGTYFFTVVTYQRRGFLTDEIARDCLHLAIDEIRHKWPFEIIATVLLPDHFHTIWTFPRGDVNYSRRIRRIKEQFTRRYLEAGGTELQQSKSRDEHGERGIWQRRFWEHTIRDELDLQRSVDYIHWNPVKHGVTRRVKDWRWSSFHRFVEEGEYDAEWGGEDPTPGFDTPEWNG